MSGVGPPSKQRETKPLRRVSSLVLNSPDIPSAAARRSDAKSAGPSSSGVENLPHGIPTPIKSKVGNEEVIPDSEEERILRSPNKGGTEAGSQTIPIIEISSDEDDARQLPPPLPQQNIGTSRVPNRKAPISDDPFLDLSIPGAWPKENVPPKPTKEVLSSPKPPKSVKKFRTPRSRRVIQSSSSEGSDDEPGPHNTKRQVVIELTDSSPERPPRGTDTPSSIPKSVPRTPARPAREREPVLPLYVDDDDDEPWMVNDGSILTINEPKTARKPIRLTPKPSASTPSKPGKSTSNPAPSNTDEAAKKSAVTNVPSSSTPSSSPTKKKNAPRQTKKSRAAEEQARREAYAQEVFVELNKSVFEDGLPKETKLKWSKRLLTTAGKARWHRSRDGIETSEIELAMKVLDCDERIRNTLSHEMCHLACWVINGDLTEVHGRIWKGWAAKVMRKRPDIEVTTKHSYDISYPYEWKCEQCSKIYGRYSKSINPDECACGACKVGKLIPLFPVPTQPPKTTAGSKMAAGKAQDSPRPIPRPPPTRVNVETNTELLSSVTTVHYIEDSSSDTDSEVGDLVTTLEGVHL